MWLVNAVGHTLLADYLLDPLLGLVGVSSAIEPLAAVFKIKNAAHRREKFEEMEIAGRRALANQTD